MYIWIENDTPSPAEGGRAVIRSRPQWPRETPSFYPAYEQLSYSSSEHSEPMPTADPDEHREASGPRLRETLRPKLPLEAAGPLPAKSDRG